VAKAALISVVDDDDSVRDSLRGLLRSVTFGVEVFASAEQFLSSDLMRETDCLILDVHMPGMSGLELVRRATAELGDLTTHGSRASFPASLL